MLDPLLFDPLIVEFKRIVFSKFGYLETELGFRRIETSSGLKFMFDFIGDRFGVEIDIRLDQRERDIGVLLVRLEDGKLPDGYYESKGKPCRVFLLTWARKHGLAPRLDKHSMKKKQKFDNLSSQAMERQLGEEAELLRRCWELISKNPEGIFETEAEIRQKGVNATRQKAEEFFQNEDYQSAVALYELINDDLTVAETEMFELAKKFLGQRKK